MRKRINAGIESYRVKCVAGYVTPSETAVTGGHAYCTYLADREEGDQNWVCLDWCMYEDSDIPCELKPLLNDGGYDNTYGDIWFSFNNEYSWSNEENDIVIDKSVKSLALALGDM
ncbi:hypothetical protein QOZ83_16730 [Romboutsia sedimentorum]|uniref:hypothetical protein n=1 Tax=Romboutsia sedimentorum TaxID=1368474 RepID=UPI0024DE05B1|nr:hypothetical protein [Romboutsia sedimentorum]MDK2587487.1 hypothetical protein [Romboutsia sedimentorum]